jgi:molecular chaperone GrpE (heat shock protein)
LQKTATLLTELEEGLKERADNLERIRAEYNQYSKLAAVEEEKAKAIVQQIELYTAVRL